MRILLALPSDAGRIGEQKVSRPTRGVIGIAHLSRHGARNPKRLGVTGSPGCMFRLVQCPTLGHLLAESTVPGATLARRGVGTAAVATSKLIVPATSTRVTVARSVLLMGRQVSVHMLTASARHGHQSKGERQDDRFHGAEHSWVWRRRDSKGGASRGLAVRAAQRLAPRGMTAKSDIGGPNRCHPTNRYKTTSV